MSPVQAFFRGFARLPGLLDALFFLWLANLLVALPAGVMLSEALREAIGPSRVHENLRSGLDLEWHGELAARADGLAATFEPSTVTGAGPFLDNLDAWLTGELFTAYPGLVALGVAFALVWTLLLGGVLSRLADPARPPGLERLLAGGGRYFFRLLRLALLAAPLYWLIYRLGRWLYRRIADGTGDVTEETTVLAWSLAAAALVVILLHLVRVAFDYAKIAVVVEERRSALGAALAGFRFALGHPVKAFGLYWAFSLLAVLLLAAWSMVAPGGGQTSVLGVVAVFLLGQVYLVARLGLRVALLAGETELYEGRGRRL